MKVWSVVFVIITAALLLSSCGNAGEATKAVSQAAPGQSCEAYCQTQQPGDCEGSWVISGVAPSCKCDWACKETRSTAGGTAAPIQQGTSPVLDDTILWSKDRLLSLTVGAGNAIKDNAVEFTPSTSQSQGDLLTFSGPALIDSKTVNVYKKGPRDKEFKLALEAPVNVKSNVGTATAPLWGSDAGKTLSAKVVKNNGEVVDYTDDLQLTLIPKGAVK